MRRHIASPATIRCPAAWALVALLGIFGCGSAAKQNLSGAGTATPKAADVVPDLVSAANCTVSTVMNDPKEHFHLSLSRKDDDRPAPYISEADFTPDNVTGTSNWRSSQDAQQISSVHSDAKAWDATIMLLAAPLTQSVVSDLRMAQSTAISAGPDPVGGYDAIKYTFDTARLAEAEKLRFEHLMRANDLSVTGTVWITKDALCLVKYVTDYHFTAAKDNSMGSVHNEGSLTKQ
jgi:hypothetical protein